MNYPSTFLNRKNVFVMTSLSLLLVLAVLLSISVGSTSIEPIDVALAKLMSMNDVVVQYRFERTLASVLTGIALGVAGLLMQISTRNPLADPYILGISSGALFATNIALLFQIVSKSILTIAAFLGGLLAFTAASTLAVLGGYTATSLVLSGIAVASFLTGVSYAISYFVYAKMGLPIHLVLLGSVSMVTHSDIPIYGFCTILGVSIAISVWKRMNVILYGDEYSYQLGYDPRITRFILVSTAVLLTSVSVAFVGVVGFVGLAAPHIVRSLIGEDARLSIPSSAIVGALITVCSDIVVRLLSGYTYLGELPLGIITSIFGAPLMAYLVVTRMRSL